MSVRNLLLITVIGFLTSFNERENQMQIEITRFVDEPIIKPYHNEEIGFNVQGPSLIKVPTWVEKPLGKYYLYFADHKGDRIKMAFSDSLSGPWQIYKGGVLSLADSNFLTAKPKVPKDFDLTALEPREVDESLRKFIPKKIDDLTIPHIASPDVHVDDLNNRVLMYFHGLDEFGLQKTRVATSSDGVNFVAKEKIVGWPYFRKFSYRNEDYALSMPGVIYKRNGDIEDFKILNQLMEENTRHSAVMVRNDFLLIFFTRKGDSPERILMTTIDLSKPIMLWRTSEPVEVLKPEKEWEGANLPLYKSVASAINTPVNQLRDPALFFEGGKNYLLYSVRGENGIGIVQFSIKEP